MNTISSRNVRWVQRAATAAVILSVTGCAVKDDGASDVDPSVVSIPRRGSFQVENVVGPEPVTITFADFPDLPIESCTLE